MNGPFEMADASGREPTQTSRIGPCGALFLYSLAAGLCLSGPVLLTLAGFTGSAAGLLLAGVLCTVLCAPLGVVLWANTDNEREYNRRLDTVGGGGGSRSHRTDRLGRRRRGRCHRRSADQRAGAPTFEATWKRSKHPALRFGLRLPAVADPADHLFRFDF